MDLVDRHRAVERARLARRSASHSSSAHSCCGSCTTDAVLGGTSVSNATGSAFRRISPSGREDLVLVVRARADAGQEQLPDAGRAERAHRVDAPVPVVEVADDGDRARARRPDGERGARDAVDLAHVRAEALPQLLVAALAEQVQVELADRRQEAVRVVDRDRAGVAVVDLELVGERQLGALDVALEDAAGVDLLERRVLAVRAPTSSTFAAAGRNVRTTTEPFSGCAPR